MNATEWGFDSGFSSNDFFASVRKGDSERIMTYTNAVLLLIVIAFSLICVVPVYLRIFCMACGNVFGFWWRIIKCCCFCFCIKRHEHQE